MGKMDKETSTSTSRGDSRSRQRQEFFHHEKSHRPLPSQSSSTWWAVDGQDRHHHHPYSQASETQHSHQPKKSLKYYPSPRSGFASRDVGAIPPRAPTPPNAVDLPRPRDRDFAVWVEERNDYVFPFDGEEGEEAGRRREYDEGEGRYGKHHHEGYYYSRCPPRRVKTKIPIPPECSACDYGYRYRRYECNKSTFQRHYDEDPMWQERESRNGEETRRRKKEEKERETVRLLDEIEEIRLERKVREIEDRLARGERERERRVRKGDRVRHYWW